MSQTAFRVVTKPFELAAGLIDYLDEPTLAFLRHGEGLVGVGVSARLSASGANRVQDLSAQWQNLVTRATVEDPVQLPGSGLTAFGSISYGHASALESVLVVPKLLIGVRDGRGWITSFEDAHVVATPQIARKNPPTQLKPGQLDEASFVAAVADAVALIRSNQLEKVVLARDLTAEVPADFDLRSVISRMASEYADCWTYAVEGTFGASPELLVRVSHGQVATRVLAGTAERAHDDEALRLARENLLNSSKDLAEHQLALDSVVNVLRPLTDRIDFDEKPFVVTLPNLIHLASDVHAVISPEVTGLDLVAALHPTAAVAGTPRDVATEVIGRFEPFDRGRFAAPVGWISATGDCEWAIALRGGQLADGRITAYAGCGVVADSVAATELAETELKFRPVRSALS